MSAYPHTLVITEPATREQTPSTGALSTATDTEVFRGAADVQDRTSAVRRRGELRGEASPPSPEHDAEAFLEDETSIASVKTGQDAEVTWEDGSTRHAKVAGIRRLDGMVELNWV